MPSHSLCFYTGISGEWVFEICKVQYSIIDLLIGFGYSSMICVFFVVCLLYLSIMVSIDNATIKGRQFICPRWYNYKNKGNFLANTKQQLNNSGNHQRISTHFLQTTHQRRTTSDIIIIMAQQKLSQQEVDTIIERILLCHAQRFTSLVGFKFKIPLKSIMFI